MVAKPEVTPAASLTSQARRHNPASSSGRTRSQFGGSSGGLINWLSVYPRRERWMAFFRRFWPIVRIPIKKVFVIFLDEDVREVITHDREFPVPWGGRMMHVTGRNNFVLGMENGPEYRRNYEQIAAAFKREDVETIVVREAFQESERILKQKAQVRNGTATIDAVRELMWGVPAALCDSYYGIEIPDKLEFADWSVDISNYLFTSSTNSLSNQGEAGALAAASRYRELFQGSIERIATSASRGVVLRRLVDMEREKKLTRDELMAHLFGMVTGFIPTDLLAGGPILATLLGNSDWMKFARKAVEADDDRLLWRCLQEALRFRHINLGVLRMTGPAGYTLAAGTDREKRIPPSWGVLASTQSAMFDSRRIAQPRVFDPNRPDEDYLVFGFGQHWCVGKYIAIAQITQTFKVLLKKRGLRPAPGTKGKLQMRGVYPAHLEVQFDV